GLQRRPAFLGGSVDVYVLANETIGNTVANGQRQEAPDYFNDGDWYALAKWVKAGGHLVWLPDGIAQADYLNAPTVVSQGPAHDDAVTVAPASLAAGVRSVS